MQHRRKDRKHELEDGEFLVDSRTFLTGITGRDRILNDKVLEMLRENQIFKKRLTQERYTLIIRDDVAYRKFSGTKVRFSINSSQIKYLIVNSEK